MAKQLNIILDNKDHERLTRAKKASGKKSWRDFIMKLIQED